MIAAPVALSLLDATSAIIGYGAVAMLGGWTASVRRRLGVRAAGRLLGGDRRASLSCKVASAASANRSRFTICPRRSELSMCSVTRPRSTTRQPTWMRMPASADRHSCCWDRDVRARSMSWRPAGRSISRRHILDLPVGREGASPVALMGLGAGRVTLPPASSYCHRSDISIPREPLARTRQAGKPRAVAKGRQTWR
jgi:hypothetical protein